MQIDKAVANILCALSFLVAPGASAAFAPPVNEESIDTMCKTMVTDILSGMKGEIEKHAHLPGVDDIVYFTPEIDFNAMADSKYNKIYISRGMCLELFRLAEATALVRHGFPDKFLQASDYAKYMAQQGLLAKQQEKPGEPISVEVQPFHQWAKLDLSTLDSGTSELAIDMRNLFLHDSLLLIIGHELGHLINKDRHERLDKYAQLQQQAEKQMARWREASADKIALKITQPLGLMNGNAASMNALIGILNRSHSILITNQDQTHPPTVCRIAFIMVKGGFFTELAAAKIPPTIRRQFDEFVRQEAAKRNMSMSINDISDLEALYKEVLGSDLCVDYWDSPLKIFSATKKGLDASEYKERLIGRADDAPVILSGLLMDGANWATLKNLSVAGSVWNCGDSLSSLPLTVAAQSPVPAFQCRRHVKRLTPKPVFDAITEGRTLLINYIDPASARPGSMLVYGLLMRYSGIPRMMAIYYIDLDSYQAGVMDPQILFVKDSSVVEIGLAK